MIDYNLLHKSTLFYEALGFKRIESPWLVSKKILDITKPPESESYNVTYAGKSKEFVASGEQSFLYLINKGFIPHGKYQTITPCMRYETFDDYHTKYFMKNELIIYGDDVNKDMVHNLIDLAQEFFIDNLQMELLINREKAKDLCNVVKTDIGFDIEIDGIEVGSYGMRSCNFADWIYGTGIAEPRFSRVLFKLGVTDGLS